MDTEVVHLFAGEKFRGEGRSLRLWTVTACGQTVDREGDYSTSMEATTCDACLSAFHKAQQQRQPQ